MDNYRRKSYLYFLCSTSVFVMVLIPFMNIITGNISKAINLSIILSAFLANICYGVLFINKKPKIKFLYIYSAILLFMLYYLAISFILILLFALFLDIKPDPRLQILSILPITLSVFLAWKSVKSIDKKYFKNQELSTNIKLTKTLTNLLTIITIAIITPFISRLWNGLDYAISYCLPFGAIEITVISFYVITSAMAAIPLIFIYLLKKHIPITFIISLLLSIFLLCLWHHRGIIQDAQALMVFIIYPIYNIVITSLTIPVIGFVEHLYRKQTPRKRVNN